LFGEEFQSGDEPIGHFAPVGTQIERLKEFPPGNYHGERAIRHQDCQWEIDQRQYDLRQIGCPIPKVTGHPNNMKYEAVGHQHGYVFFGVPVIAMHG